MPAVSRGFCRVLLTHWLMLTACHCKWAPNQIEVIIRVAAFELLLRVLISAVGKVYFPPPLHRKTHPSCTVCVINLQHELYRLPAVVNLTLHYSSVEQREKKNLIRDNQVINAANRNALSGGIYSTETGLSSVLKSTASLVEMLCYFSLAK